MDAKEISNIRKNYPQEMAKKIAEELYNVQPMNINMKALMESFHEPKILNCSCGTTLMKIEGFFKEVEVTCGCGKIWQLSPVCKDFGLMWWWREKKDA
jgi:hypothetical protein